MLKNLFIISFIAISMTGISSSFAANQDAVSIKINMTSSAKDNRYFLCTPGIGCLSIKAARNGKVFSVYHPVALSNLFITNVSTMRVQAIGLPGSCRTKVEPNQTLTISGHIVGGQNQPVRVSNLYCTVRRG